MPFSKRSSAHAAAHGKTGRSSARTKDEGVRAGSEYAYDFEQEERSKRGGFGPSSSRTEGHSRYEAVDDIKSKSKKKRSKKKVAITVAVILVLLVAGAGTAVALYINNINSTLQGDDDEENMEILDSLAPTVGDEPFYALLLGCDDRDGVDGARSDTAILVRIDPDEGQVTMLSIPRDTAITYGDYGTVKFNAAYSYDGASGSIDAASELCGVKISHYAEIHFDELVDLIDYIGGVEVDVPMAINDSAAGGKLKAGKQTLNGKQALIFARSRSYSTGDFQRTTNQRLLVEAAIEKITSMSATELPGVVTKIAKCISTDYDVSSLLALASAFSEADELTIYSALLPSTTATGSDGASYVVADVEALEEMMEVIDSGGDPSTVEASDYTVSSSDEAEEEGAESYEK